MLKGSLSVESRVKAHISTPYIDADGRGTREAYARDFATCMLDPQSFREREKGAGLEAQMLRDLEQEQARVLSRNEEKSAAIRSAMASHVVQSNEEAAPIMEVLSLKRAEDREADREADVAEHLHLYQKRNESILAQRAFDESLKPSAEAKVRDREESVGRRHRELMALRMRANASQSQAIQCDADRIAAAAALGELNLARKLSEQADAQREELAKEAKEAYEGIVRERERQTQLRKLEEGVRLKQEVQFMMWARDRDEALASATRLSEASLAAQSAVHASEMEVHAAVAAGSYDRMKSLHAKLEAMCAELGAAIKQVHKQGSCLNLLMLAAKEKACERGVGFKALTCVCRGTLAPTVYTPTVLPQPEKRSSTVACQTNVSEPIRSIAQRKGSRI